MTRAPRFLTDPKPAPALKPEPKLMTRKQLAAIYGTRHADAVMLLRACERRVI